MDMDINKKQNLIILSGPTASGKTSLSIKLAKEIGGNIISADSVQVYKGMDIGSAKISAEEMEGVPHYLIDVLEPEDDFSIALFKQYAVKNITQINEKGAVPIIVGGTGFYIQALLYDIDFDDEANEDTSIRDELTALANMHGNEFVHNMLKEVDSESALQIHPNNIKRVIRAIEFFRQTGKKISDHNIEQREKKSPYNYKYFVINVDRDTLYRNIDKRVDIMIERGLVDEVRRLRNRGLSKKNISMQGLGYKEILSYLDGEITLDNAIEIIKRDTRHFAKRQITWFKRERDVVWINKEGFDFDEDRMIDFIKEQLKNEGII